MMKTTATVQTQNASKYIAQLCKHFAHKVDVVHSEQQGECRFVCGTARLYADPDRLRVEVIASDEAQVAETQDVVERHLLRFAFKEELRPLIWQPLEETGADAAIASEE